MASPCQKCVYYATGLYDETGFCLRYILYRGRGKLVYDFASNARSDESKCGLSARLFVPRSHGILSQGRTVVDQSPRLRTKDEFSWYQPDL
jgi:hypothetical protein